MQAQRARSAPWGGRLADALRGLNDGQWCAVPRASRPAFFVGLKLGMTEAAAQVIERGVDA